MSDLRTQLVEKFRRGRPVEFSPEEADYLRERLREAMAVALERPPEEIADDAQVFAELGLDSVDVFDVLDQLGEVFEAGVELEELPEEMIYGREELTFREFAGNIVAFFRSSPPARG